MNKLVKPAVAIALVFILIRIILEQAGLSGPLVGAFGVTWLHLIFPVVLGYSIARSGADIPFRRLFLSIAAFTLVVRLLVAVSYSMAYVLDVSGPRFDPLAGESFLQGAVLTPLYALVFVSIAAIAIGFLLGALALVVSRKVLA